MHRPSIPRKTAAARTRLAGFALSVASSLAVASCAPPTGEISIMSYNVKNLFDGEDSGSEYPDFSVADGSWSGALYAERLDLAAEALRLVSKAGGAGESPDIVALIEIENAGVARDLAERLGPGYVALAAPAQGCAMTVGILSRLPVSRVRVHAMRSPPSGSPARPILEAELETEAGPLIVLVNHWKSRKEGPAETEADRVAQAESLRAIIEERLASRPGLPLVACGDFNEDPEAFSPSPPGYRTALSLGDAAEGGVSSPIVLGAEAVPGDQDALALASTWLKPGVLAEGSYAYRGIWERIDAFLLAPGLSDGRGIDYLAFPCPRPALLLDGEGFPRAWSTRDTGGYSDHLPLLLLLRSLPPPRPGVQ